MLYSEVRIKISPSLMLKLVKMMINVASALDGYATLAAKLPQESQLN